MSSIDSLNFTKLKLFAKENGITIPGLAKYRAADIAKLRNEIKKNLKKSPVKQRKSASPKKRKSPLPKREASPKRKSPSRSISRASLQSLGITKLKAVAKDVGVTGYSKFKSGDISSLISLIMKAVSKKSASPKRKSPKAKSPKRKSASPKRSKYSKVELKKLNITKLKAIAKEVGVKGYSKYKSGDIDTVIGLIMKASVVETVKEKKVAKAKRAIIILEDEVDKSAPRDAAKADQFKEDVIVILEKQEKKKISKKQAKQQLQESLEDLKQVSNRQISAKAQKVVETIVDVLDMEKMDNRSVKASENQEYDKHVRNILDKGDEKYPDEEDYIEKVINSVKQMTGEESVDVNASQLAEFKNTIKRCFASV